MGLFDWVRRAGNDRQAIALDIGTEFVKVLVFEVEDGVAKVTGVGRQRQRLADMQGGTVTDIHGVIKNCEVALEAAAEQAGYLPEQVIMGIAGELVKGITTTIKYVRPEPLKKITIALGLSYSGKLGRRRSTPGWSTPRSSTFGSTATK